MAARTVAVEITDRNVIVGRRGDRDVGKRRGDGRPVAGHTARDALMCAGHGVEREVTGRRVTLRTRRGGRNVIGRFGSGDHIARKSRYCEVATSAVAGRGMQGVECGRGPGVPRGCGRAGDHAQVRRGFMAGLAQGHGAGDRRVPSRCERRVVDARRADIEAPGVHVGRGMAARTVAVEITDRNVIVGSRGDRDVGKRRGDGRPVAGHTARDALMCAGHRVEGIVTRCRVTLCAGGVRRDVVSGLAGAGHITGECGSGRVTAPAVSGGRMHRVEAGRRTRISRGRGARDHSEETRSLVARLATGYRGGDGRVSAHTQSRAGDAGGPEVEAARAYIARAMASGTVAVEIADRNMTAAGRGDRDVSKTPRHARGVATEALGDSLVSSGHRIEREIVRGRVALLARCVGRNVIGWSQRIGRE